MKDNLLIVWTNEDIEVANKFPLLYSSVILERILEKLNIENKQRSSLNESTKR